MKGSTYYINVRTAVALSAVLAWIAAPSDSAAVDVKGSSQPILQGSGVNHTALYQNVAMANGQSVDLYARFLALSPANKTPLFVVENDDMKFQFINGVPGEVNTATIRWTFYKSGTTTPVALPNFALTVDDLDNLPSRQEILSTSDAVAYDVNSPTNVVASLLGSKVTAAGSNSNQNPGEPEGAVKLYFKDVSSFVISYHTVFGSADKSAYHHDGDGDFTFSNPKHTPIPRPLDCSLPRLYYTYRFQNTGYVPVLARFTNKLPSGLTWDTAYTPKVTENLQIEVVFERNDQEAHIPFLWLPPGDSSMTLCTIDFEKDGEIENEAEIETYKAIPKKPVEPSHDENWENKQKVKAAITLDPVDEVRQFICEFKNSQLCLYGWLVLGKGTRIGSQVIGKVGVAPGAELDIGKPEDMPTALIADPGATVTGAGSPTGTANLSTEKAAALALSSQAKALSPTRTFGTISSSTVINGTAPGGMNVISVDTIELKSTGVDLTIQGGPDDYFIFNIASALKMTSGSKIVFNGIDASRVLFNVKKDGEVDISGHAIVMGVTLLAPQADVSIGGGAKVTGSVVSGGTKSKLHGGGTIDAATALGGCEPCCGP